MEDSSPDLSLKLRRGSSDSRDSFYMDFTQGIDSDIEDIATTTSGGGGVTTSGCGIADVTTMIDDAGGCDAERDNATDNSIPAISPTALALDSGTPKEEGPSWPTIPPNNVSGDSGTCSSHLGGGDQLLPSPASPTPVIVSPETLSHHSSSSPAKHPPSVTGSLSHHQKHSSIGGTGSVGGVRISGISSVGGVTPSCSHHVSLSSPVRHGGGGGSSISGCGGSVSGVCISGSTGGASRHSNLAGSGGGARHHQQSGPLAVAPLSFHPGGSGGHHHHHHVGGASLQLPALRRPSCKERQTEWKQLGADALATTLSALYGKLLVVMGTAFPMAEVISTYIPPSFYEWYYLYLYIGSMLFLLYMYVLLLSEKKYKKKTKLKSSSTERELSIADSGEESGTASSSQKPSDSDSNSSFDQRRYVDLKSRRMSFVIIPQPQYHYGSFYLRMGAVAFGIGSMIYSGLEFGQYFEVERNTKCHNVMLALTPATRMAFIFIQMYFIFLTNEQMKVYKHKITARFGLMHMIGTNLSVWLNVLVQETKHEILTFYNPENNSLRISHRLGSKASRFGSHENLPAPAHRIVARGLKGPHNIYECRRTNIIGSLVQDASPFLFPCTIEYSLICAAILYVMWKNISKQNLPPKRNNVIGIPQNPEALTYKKSPHHYSVDCARAHKGLFVGILILVLTIISLILFFVLISRPEFVNLAVMEVNICELTLYGVSTLASIIGMFQVRILKYDGGRNLELDNILLIGAQTGMFIYSMFTIIGGQFTIEKNTILVVITALTSLVQTTFQTMFILDASRRSCVTPDQIRRKPGREIVTFLLVTNLAMWAISTLEKSRAESHPIQLHFYGLWAWTIITHVSMPLAIFYRFHSTVCLCEIWKRAYKMKPAYM